jgi:hypothetical protein
MAAAAAPAELELEAELEDESPEVVAKLPLLLKCKSMILSDLHQFSFIGTLCFC